MAFSFNSLLAKLKGFSHTTPSISKGDDLFSIRHWELFCAFLLLGGMSMVALSGYFFYQTAYTTSFSDGENGSARTPSFSRNALEDTIKKFADKKRVFEELKRERPSIAKP